MIVEHEVVEVAEERRRAYERVEVLRVADVAGMHDDELVDEAVRTRPVVVLRRRLYRVRVHPVRDDDDPLRQRSLLLEPLAHRLADRDHAIGAPQVEADERAEKRDERAGSRAA